jgi:hypothetical protein
MEWAVIRDVPREAGDAELQLAYKLKVLLQ